MEYLKFKRKDLGWWDPDRKIPITSIEGRKNRPGIDAFVHLGYDYPDFMKDNRKRKSWAVESDWVVVELDTSEKDTDKLITDHVDKQVSRPDKEDKLYKDLIKRKGN